MKAFLHLLFVASSVALAPNAFASRPVPVTITGCVSDGTFFSEVTDFGTHRVEARSNRYPIKLYYSSGSSDAPDASTAVPLQRYEGNRLVATGHLLPGDIMFVDHDQIVITGNCATGEPR